MTTPTVRRGEPDQVHKREIKRLRGGWSLNRHRPATLSSSPPESDLALRFNVGIPPSILRESDGMSTAFGTDFANSIRIHRSI